MRPCVADCLKVIDDALSTRGSVTVIFLDMKKAFNRAFHPRLLNKMASYDIVDPILPWFSSYLSFTNEAVQINGFISEPRLMSTVVIQSRVLDLLPRPSYVNNLFDVIQTAPLFPLLTMSNCLRFWT